MEASAASEPAAEVEHRLLAVIEAATGLVVTGNRRRALLRHVRARSTELAVTQREYTNALATRPGSPEMHSVTAMVTNQETSFFRGPRQLANLEATTLRPLLTGGAGPKVRLWSAACSTGEEALTLGMMIRDITGRSGLESAVPAVEIVASDLCIRTVETARRGRYSLVSEARLGPVRTDRYFKPVNGALIADWNSLPPIEFHVHNLVDPPRFGRFDVVLVRNVMFYLSETARRQVIRNVERSLQPGGVAVFGANDGVRLPDQFRSIGAHCYRLEGP